MNIALISDIHNGELIECRPGEEAIPLLSKFVLYCKEHNVSMILELGDRVNNHNHDSDVQNLRNVKDVFDSSGITIYHAIGNHDVHYLEKNENLALLGMEDRYYSIETQDFQIIVLDTTDRIIGDCGGYIGEEQIIWLEKQLASSKKKALICSHHPFIYQNQNGNPFFVSIPDEYRVLNGEKVVDLISRYHDKVSAVINGHVHWNYLKYIKGVPYYSVASFLENFPLKENAPGRFSILDYENESIFCSSMMLNPTRTLGMFELQAK